MYIVGNVYISDAVAEEYFICDLNSCKGACCVEGDGGAPLSLDELPIMREIYPKVKPFLNENGKKTIKKEGVYTNILGDYATPLVNHKECAYSFYDEQGILKCGIEQAYLAGKIQFQKPISCHLYPIRITKLGIEEALNYEEWHICDCAIKKGTQHKVPLYVFLKEPLVRKYGLNWYEELCEKIKNNEKASNLED
jgi:hypothetical protein